MGNAYISQSNLVEAQKAYDLAISKGINLLSMHWNLYDVYIRQGKRLKAKKELEFILQIEPENREAKKKMEGFSR